MFLDERLLGATSNAVERGNRRYRKMQKTVYRVRTKAGDRGPVGAGPAPGESGPGPGRHDQDPAQGQSGMTRLPGFLATVSFSAGFSQLTHSGSTRYRLQICNDSGRHDAGRIPARRAGRATGRGPGPTGRRGPRPAAAAAMPFSLTLPAPPTGAGGDTTRAGSAATHRIVLSGPRAPPVIIRGRSGPEGGHDARPTRPGRPGPSTAEPAVGMTRTRGGPAAGAGRHRNGRDAGILASRREPAGEVRPRQRALSRPNEDVHLVDTSTGADPTRETGRSATSSAGRQSSPSWSTPDIGSNAGRSAGPGSAAIAGSAR